MSFERPTLATLKNRAISDIQTRMAGADARLRRSFENVIARVVAGVGHGLHGHLVFLSRQLFADTAIGRFLRRIAAIFGVIPTEPTYSQGNVTITGTDTTPVPAGTAWVRADGVEFTTDVLTTISGSSIVAAVTATVLGSDGNTDASTELGVVTPIANIDSTATVDGDGLTDGNDAELDPSLRSRLLTRIQTPPSGGGPGDYERWAREIPGVTRAWQKANELGPGTVALRFATDNEASPIPSGAKVAEVQAHIDAKAPVTAVVTVSAPIDAPLAMTIAVLPNTAAVQAAVETELEAMMLRDGHTDAVTLKISRIDEAISIAAGETSHVLTIPAADVTHTTGQLPSVGVITWT